MLTVEQFNCYRAYRKMSPKHYAAVTSLLSKSLHLLSPESYDFSEPEEEVDKMQQAFRQALGDGIFVEEQ